MCHLAISCCFTLANLIQIMKTPKLLCANCQHGRLIRLNRSPRVQNLESCLATTNYQRLNKTSLTMHVAYTRKRHEAKKKKRTKPNRNTNITSTIHMAYWYCFVGWCTISAGVPSVDLSYIVFLPRDQLFQNASLQRTS